MIASLRLSRTLILAAAVTTFAAPAALAGYSDEVLAEPSLHSYYRFQDAATTTGSTAEDAHDNNDDGTYQGTVTSTTGPDIGETGNLAAEFDGSSGYVNVGTLPGYGPAFDDGVTLETWVNGSYDPGGPGAGQNIFGLFNSGHTNQLVTLDQDPNTSNGSETHDDRIVTYIEDEKLSGQNRQRIRSGADGDTDITDGNGWNYLALTVSPASNDLSIYLADEGEHQTTEFTDLQFRLGNPNPSDFTDFALDALIGASNNGGSPGSFFDGALDEFALYTETLSQDDLDGHLAAIPEPASLGLMGLGGLMLLSRRRRRT